MASDQTAAFHTTVITVSSARQQTRLALAFL